MRSVAGYTLFLGHAGDARDVRELYRIGIVAVIDLAVEEPPAVLGREIVYCRFPLVDGSGNPPWLIQAAVDTTTRLLCEKVPTLIACSAGLSRSPAIAAACLLKISKTPLREALLYLSQFGGCDVSTAFLRDVAAATST